MVTRIGLTWGGVALALIAPVAAAGQVTEVVPTPTPTAAAPVVVLPTPVPTTFPTNVPTPTPTPSILPVPTQTPTPAATPPPAPGPQPSAPPSPTSRPSLTPQPTATPTPAPSPTPVAVPTPTPVPSPQPTPTATTTTVPVPDAPAEPFNWWPWLLGAAGLALLVLLWGRYQRDVPAEPYQEAPASEPEPAAGALPPPIVRRTSAPWVTLSLRPIRAGLNMVTAVADCEITITNEGGAPAEQVRTALTLLAAHAGQQVEIAEANAEPIVRSVVPAFTLEPGEARTFRGVASANLSGLPTMRAGGRDMLVPLVLLNVQHRDPDGVEHRTSQGFVVGIERVDSPKLAPFWTDTIRMVEQVAARPNGAPERRRVG